MNPQEMAWKFVYREVVISMKLGISSYCLSPSLKLQEIDVFEGLEWIKEQGAEHVEIVPIGIDLEGNFPLADAIAAKAKEIQIEVSNYSFSGDVLKETQEEYNQEIERIKKQVELAAHLGAKRVRHDIVQWGYKTGQIGQFEADFPRLVEACGTISEYAAQYGITTTIENHGFYITPSDRMLRIAHAVNRPNFKLLLDIGNFLCVDEDPVSAVKKCLPFAEVIHFKDFFIRQPYQFPGEGWLQTLSGKYIRGTIFGHGDVETRHIVRTIREFGYDGYISMEFEGMEPDKTGTRYGLDNARRFWNEA
jgi:inosose dehydratase